ncbi:hypothetical protein L228DRAFT_238321 [Xylona heveae TC161]|uniref:Uncharacterized protein n=1 Tax=Xylona heveae (strain CBS 132557 / TC161) TaxID=1328760 RepID=A0A165HPJ1_XYLHT|nr:hypothetical protein L228DRAFT_238321 [Xylona heveae TC161]KZF23803.1 hypothetical protein L228DRAFT_238321 [Xylona heveae TC161]
MDAQAQRARTQGHLPPPAYPTRTRTEEQVRAFITRVRRFSSGDARAKILACVPAVAGSWTIIGSGFSERTKLVVGPIFLVCSILIAFWYTICKWCQRAGLSGSCSHATANDKIILQNPHEDLLLVWVDIFHQCNLGAKFRSWFHKSPLYNHECNLNTEMKEVKIR